MADEHQGRSAHPVTLFTTPRAFRGPVGVIQRNALESWRRLRPACEVIVFGDDPGVAEVAAKLYLRHFPAMRRNVHGTPLLNGLFAAAERAASHDWLGYVNADIILMHDFAAAVQRVIDLAPRCLMIVRRWDLEVPDLLDFGPGWEDALRRRALHEGRRRPHTAIDGFVFPRGLWDEIPPLALGRGMWDNWLIYAARARGCPVVDVSEAVLAVHQNHDYAHQPHAIKMEADVWQTQEAKDNLALGGGYANAFSVYDATHIYRAGRLKRNITPYAVYRRLARLTVSLPILKPAVEWLRAVSARYPALRRAFLWRIPP